jgi:enterochelin esterase-like enzyme
MTTELLERAKTEGTPLINGDLVTFVWEGDTAPLLMGDFTQWSNNPVRLKESSPGVWTYTHSFPPDTYIEYLYSSDPTEEDARLYDPLNKRRITNGMGKFNHYFLMPYHKHTPLRRVRAGVPRGTVTHYTLEHSFIIAGKKRDLWLYQPPTDQPAPLLVVYDGRDYLRRARITQIVDNLIAQGKIAPVALAMIENARQVRYMEYNAGETMLALVTRFVLPLSQQHLKLIDIEQNPGAYGVVGASMGGLMALYTALRLPHLFGKAISQAGAFQLGLLPDTPALVETLIRHLPPPPIKLWQDVGTYDWLVEMNRSIHALLVEKGYDVTYREYSAGHNYTSWSNQLPEALVTMFGK